jgi:sortase A
MTQRQAMVDDAVTVIDEEHEVIEDSVEASVDDELVSDETLIDAGSRGAKMLAAGLVLSVVGLTLVLFFVYVFVFTGIRASRAQHQLLEVFTTPAGAVPLSGKQPPNGYPAAVLTIPAIKVRQLVLQGSTAAQTAQGPGIMSQAARPGTIGNAVIVGRRTTAGGPFAHLDELKVGDRIELASGLGKFTFVVRHSGTATPGRLSPATPVNRPQLTLVTASSTSGGTGLFYVVAKQQTAPGVAAKPRQKPTAADLGLSGDPAAVMPSIVLGVLYVALIAASVLAYLRFRRQVWTVYVLTTPIILAAALWWFGYLYLLLPSTM